MRNFIAGLLTGIIILFISKAYAGPGSDIGLAAQSLEKISVSITNIERILSKKYK